MNRFRTVVEIILLATIGLLGICAVVMVISQSTSLWSEKASGWAQAVGSILAILGAFGVMQRQHSLQQEAERIRAKMEAANSMSDVFDTVTDIINQVASVISQTEDGPPKPDDLNVELRCLSYIEDRLKYSDVQRMSPSTMREFFKVRGINSTAIGYIHAYIHEYKSSKRLADEHNSGKSVLERMSFAIEVFDRDIKTSRTILRSGLSQSNADLHDARARLESEQLTMGSRNQPV